MSRKAGKLFDNNFKFIIAKASSPAVVHLINGLFPRNYPPNTIVEVRKPRELIKENPESGNLGEIFTDMVVILSSDGKKDTYLIEAQIKDDSEMVLRVFNYSVQIALENKSISADGSRLLIDMPAPAVVYLETSNTKDFLTIEVKFPGDKSVTYNVPAFKVLEHKVSELEHMALLLPFYILRIRKELEKQGTDSEKRKELAKELSGYVAEICEVLQRSKENSYITDVDVAMLQERMSNMHSRLYGGYKEFREDNMTIEQMYNKSVLKKIDDAEARAEARAEAKAELKAEKRISQVAKAMKTAGEAIDKIMNYTGLSRRKIAAL
ncbi:MAG: hypothetical protein FWC26_03800 [Fibromonadales bacterium]|nr:hypothetical protein [Fibromonadales bacterium]